MAPRPIANNTLFYGDNLAILREHAMTESVNLVYLDPPFNSNRNYNVLFRDESGKDSESQITAFEDTWPYNAMGGAVFLAGQCPQCCHRNTAILRTVGPAIAGCAKSGDRYTGCVATSV